MEIDCIEKRLVELRNNIQYVNIKDIVQIDGRKMIADW